MKRPQIGPSEKSLKMSHGELQFSMDGTTPHLN